MHCCPLASVTSPCRHKISRFTYSLVLFRLGNYCLRAILPHQSLGQSRTPLLKELLALWGCFNKESLSFALHQLMHYPLNKATLVCAEARAGLNVRVTSSGRAVEHLHNTPTWQHLACHCFKFISSLLHWAGQKLAKVNVWWVKWVLLWDLSILFSFLTTTGWLLWCPRLAPVLLKTISWCPEMPLSGNQELICWEHWGLRATCSVLGIISTGWKQLWWIHIDCSYQINLLFSVILCKENSDFGWSGNSTKWFTRINHKWERTGPYNLAT